MITPNKSIRHRLIILAVVFVIAALAEYLTMTLLSSTPMLVVKIQMLIGVAIMTYLLYSAFKIWQLVNSRFYENGKSDKN